MTADEIREEIELLFNPEHDEGGIVRREEVGPVIVRLDQNR